MPHHCKFCGYYQPTGRRGGICSVLNSFVCGRQDACCLAIPAFKTATLPLSAVLGVDELASLPATDEPTPTLPELDVEDELLSL
ncbi:MAG: hypothetical protein AAGG51_27185 [Cyanobacteria bacterium P01_G01_bin.54]